eukprot:TRINITY_DN25693_c0_g1_i1.p1 TRINITY_DN25693_c0_g1~~TRINITY_DN25693_c0_g1_i1.p1  ORF type:complete len:123 (+),score=11.03 TRINITY_DN25693_c0_g1_i1:49-369(+)
MAGGANFEKRRSSASGAAVTATQRNFRSPGCDPPGARKAFGRREIISDSFDEPRCRAALRGRVTAQGDCLDGIRQDTCIPKNSFRIAGVPCSRGHRTSIQGGPPPW